LKGGRGKTTCRKTSSGGEIFKIRLEEETTLGINYTSDIKESFNYKEKQNPKKKKQKKKKKKKKERKNTNKGTPKTTSVETKETMGGETEKDARVAQESSGGLKREKANGSDQGGKGYWQTRVRRGGPRSLRRGN